MPDALHPPAPVSMAAQPPPPPSSPSTEELVAALREEAIIISQDSDDDDAMATSGLLSVAADRLEHLAGLGAPASRTVQIHMQTPPPAPPANLGLIRDGYEQGLRDGRRGR